MNRSPIEWLRPFGRDFGYTWNPLRGCSKVDRGCKNCYACRHGARFAAKGLEFHQIVDPATGNWTGNVTSSADRMREPLQMRTPALIFAGSMSDIFHEHVTIPVVLQIFETMAFASQHTFIVLTKREHRMRYLLSWPLGGKLDPQFPAEHHRLLCTMPLANVILGVSAHDRESAERRLNYLMETPARGRLLSYEPGFGRLKLESTVARNLDWIITGGESGPGAEPSDPDVFRLIRDMALGYEIPFLFKQWGEWAPARGLEGTEAGDLGVLIDGLPVRLGPRRKNSPPKIHKLGPERARLAGRSMMIRYGKRRAGRLLDGREWNGFPKMILERTAAA